MDCEECQEQVLALIEREAEDPTGVHAILDACPECRARFDELKTLLETSANLGTEEPAPSIDAAVLRLADRRASSQRAPESVDEPTFLEYDTRRSQRLPWAIAAVALLGIGFGYLQSSNWGREGDPLAMQTDQDAAVESSPADDEPRQDEALDMIADAVPAAAPAEERQARAGSTAHREPRAPKTQQPARPKGDRKREKKSAVGGAEIASVYMRSEETEASTVQADAAPAFGSARTEAGSAAFADEDTSDVEDCRAVIDDFETRRGASPSDEPSPEDALRAGVCYQQKGQRRKARRWLELAAASPNTADRARAALERLKER